MRADSTSAIDIPVSADGYEGRAGDVVDATLREFLALGQPRLYQENPDIESAHIERTWPRTSLLLADPTLMASFTVASLPSGTAAFGSPLRIRAARSRLAAVNTGVSRESCSRSGIRVTKDP